MTTDKFPPHSLDAEAAVLGSILIDSDQIRSLTLSPGDFYHEPHSIIFNTMLKLKEEGKGINQITVAQKLDELGKLEESGGVAFLSHIISETPISLDCQHYADIVQRLSSSRRLILAGESISKLGYNANGDATASLAKADGLLLELRKTAGGSHIITPEDRSRILIERYTNLYSKEKGIAIETGLLDLDKRLGGGLFPGDLVILGARPGVGKTTLLECIANHVGRNNNVLFCSAEMNVGSLSDRDVAGILEVPIDIIRFGSYDDATMDKINDKALPWIAEQQIYHLDSTYGSHMTTASIYQTAYEIRERYGLSLIVVDYLGILDDKYGTNQNERLGYISRNLKQIGFTLDVPLLVAHQLSRAVEYRSDKRPQLTDLRESGNLEQDADVVLFLYREDYYYKTEEEWNRDFPQGNPYYNSYPGGIVEILTAKKRQGAPGKGVRVLWNEKHQTYQNLSYKED